jgi:hypothetical protein
MDYSWRNLNNIYQHVLKLGMLSPPEDVIASWLIFGSLPKVDKFLELGSYIGGGLAIFNEALHETGHNSVKFTGVDHLEFIGAKSQGKSGAWYSDHFSKCLTDAEVAGLAVLETGVGAQEWIKERAERLTGKALDLVCYKNLKNVTNKFDIVHHDYGDSVAENLETICTATARLNDDGIYIIDDWCTGAPLRTWASVLAQQQGLLYPILWGRNKVFFAKNLATAESTVQAILANPEFNPQLFKLMPGSDFFGSDYKTIRMHWQAMQWS